MAPLRARLCSGNPHKLAELRASLPGWELELLEADGFPAEDGETYEENARGKAAYGREVGDAGAWMLGEDSGIEVAALGGAPGIASARWADDGVEALLSVLDGVADRRARYICGIVALGPHDEELCVSGVLRGSIALAPRGTEGFGYDPIFLPAGEQRTVAELGDEWKRTHSHRARAAAALIAEMARTDTAGSDPGTSAQAASAPVRRGRRRSPRRGGPATS